MVQIKIRETTALEKVCSSLGEVEANIVQSRLKPVTSFQHRGQQASIVCYLQAVSSRGRRQQTAMITFRAPIFE